MFDISLVGLPHTPKYLHAVEGAKKATSCPMYTSVSFIWRWPVPRRSTIIAQGFFLLTFNPLQSSNSRIASKRACAPPRVCANHSSDRSSTKPIRHYNMHARPTLRAWAAVRTSAGEPCSPCRVAFAHPAHSLNLSMSLMRAWHKHYNMHVRPTPRPWAAERKALLSLQGSLAQPDHSLNHLSMSLMRARHKHLQHACALLL